MRRCNTNPIQPAIAENRKACPSSHHHQHGRRAARPRAGPRTVWVATARGHRLATESSSAAPPAGGLSVCPSVSGTLLDCRSKARAGEYWVTDPFVPLHPDQRVETAGPKSAVESFSLVGPAWIVCPVINFGRRQGKANTPDIFSYITSPPLRLVF
jgi:hypothetical protein